MKWRCLLLSLIMMAVPHNALSAVIHFNDGNSLHATVLEETDETVTIEFNGRISTLKRSEIEKISSEPQKASGPANRLPNIQLKEWMDHFLDSAEKSLRQAIEKIKKTFSPKSVS